MNIITKIRDYLANHKIANALVRGTHAALSVPAANAAADIFFNNPTIAKEISPLEINLTLTNEHINLHEAPGAKKGFQTNKSKITLDEKLALTNNLKVGSAQSFTNITNPFYHNEKNGATLDKIWGRYGTDSENFKFGFDASPFLSTKVAHDPDASFLQTTFTKNLDFPYFDELTLQAGSLFNYNLNGLPSSDEQTIEATIKKTGDFNSFIAALSYTNVNNVKGTSRGNSPDADFNYLATTGKWTINTDNPLINQISIFGNYIKNMGESNENESRVVGLELSFSDNLWKITSLYFDKDKNPFPGNIAQDSLPANNSFGSATSVSTDLMRLLQADLPGELYLTATYRHGEPFKKGNIDRTDIYFQYIINLN